MSKDLVSECNCDLPCDKVSENVLNETDFVLKSICGCDNKCKPQCKCLCHKTCREWIKEMINGSESANRYLDRQSDQRCEDVEMVFVIIKYLIEKETNKKATKIIKPLFKCAWGIAQIIQQQVNLYTKKNNDDL